MQCFLLIDLTLLYHLCECGMNVELSGGSSLWALGVERGHHACAANVFTPQPPHQLLGTT